MTQNGEQPKGLESRWWYRLLRVIFLTTYVLVLVAAVALIYSENHPRHLANVARSLILCDNGKAYPLSALSSTFYWSFEDGEQLTGSDAEAALSLCGYGQTPAPTEGLATVKMPDGALVAGMPVPGTKGPDLMARYERWRSSSGIEVDAKTGERIVLGSSANEITEGKKLTVQFQTLHSYKLKLVFSAGKSWAKVISYMALGWLAIHLAFVALRGSVLYVVVGRFLPASGLRGWLTL